MKKVILSLTLILVIIFSADVVINSSSTNISTDVENDVTISPDSEKFTEEEKEILEESSEIPSDFSVSENKVNVGEDDNVSTSEIEMGFVRTLGGADNVDLMYPTLEDAKNKTNAVSISGASFDGIYLATEGDYTKFAMSGGIFYMPTEQLDIIPESEAKSFTHYENSDGTLYLYEAVDARNSEEYNVYPIGDAIEGAKENVPYYTIDQVTYYDNLADVTREGNGISTRASKLTGASYYQNLPFSSASSYTGAQYKSYLKYMGKTSSRYYNYTSSFEEAQDKYGINSLLLFSMANLESAYGTSNFANQCNNFFGRGAFDSDPSNACRSSGFSDPRSGILAQAMFIEDGYSDIQDYKFNGNHVGTKNSGLNVYYATDPNWGSKIASHAYSTDKYLKGNETGLYTIGTLGTSSKQVYKDSSLNTKLTVKNGSSGSIENYVLKQKSGSTSNSDYGVRVLIRDENSKSYEIQLPTMINNTSKACTYTYHQNGKYPTYGGTVNASIPKGVASYVCNFDSYQNQKGYISKSGVKILNDVSNVKPEDVSDAPDKNEYCSILTDEYTNDSNEKVKVYKNYYDTKDCYVTYYENSSARKNYTTEYKKSGTIYKIVDIDYSKSGAITDKKETSYSNGKKTQFLDYVYKSGKPTSSKLYIYDTNGKRIQRNEYKYNSSGYRTQRIEYYYNKTNYRLYNRKIYKYNSSKKLYYYANTNYKTRSGKTSISDYKEYYYNSSGQRTKRVEKYYNTDFSPNYKVTYYYTDSGKFIKSQRYNY